MKHRPIFFCDYRWSVWATVLCENRNLSEEQSLVILSELRFSHKSRLIVSLTSLIILYLVSNLFVQMTYNFALLSSSNRLSWNFLYLFFIVHGTELYLQNIFFYIFFLMYTWRWTMYYFKPIDGIRECTLHATLM